ncbi:putative ribonuclease H-like domain-containing protein, partial [Tanacetum coccineum]
ASSKPEISDCSDNSSEHSTCQSNDSEGSCGNTSEHSSKSESESISVPNEMSTPKSVITNEKVVSELQEVEPSCTKHVKTPRQQMKNQGTSEVKGKNCNEMMEKELGESYSFIKKKCFVCGSLSHLIKDLWNNANKVNRANHFVPRPVQLNAVKSNVNYVRHNVNSVKSNVNSVRHNVNSVRTNVNTGRFKQPVPTSNSNSFSPARPQGNWGTTVKTSAGYNWRKTRPNSNYNSGSNFVRTDHPLKNMDDRGIFDSGCSGHMTAGFFFLAAKDETSGIIKNFIRQIENQLNHKVKIIRSYNGTEFKKICLKFCGNKGIKQEYSNARTPQQNGVAERMNMTLIEDHNFSHKPNTGDPKSMGKLERNLHRFPKARKMTVGLKLSRGGCYSLGAIVYEMDAKSAFCISTIDEEVTPKTLHLNDVKRIFKYLKGNPNLGLWYPIRITLTKNFSDILLPGPILTGNPQLWLSILGKLDLISWQARSLIAEDLLHMVPTLITKVDSLETELKQTKQAMGKAIVKLVKKVKKLENILKRRNVVLTTSEDEEPEDQERVFKDIDDDPLVSFVTPTKPSGEAQEEEINPTTLEAAKTLSKVASQRSKLVDKGKRYKRRKEFKGKDFEDIKEASLVEAIRLQNLNKEETAKQVNLDALLAKRLAEEEDLTEQSKVQRKAQVSLKLNIISEADGMLLELRLEANAEEQKSKRSKPMTQSQLRIYMSNYLKNQGTWKLSQLKKLKFEEIKEEFDKLVKQVDTFVSYESKAYKGCVEKIWCKSF